MSIFFFFFFFEGGGGRGGVMEILWIFWGRLKFELFHRSSLCILGSFLRFNVQNHYFGGRAYMYAFYS